MLIENTLSYNEHGKSEAAAALRLISTQVPALKSALEVMVEQCATRYCQKFFFFLLQIVCSLHGGIGDVGSCIVATMLVVEIITVLLQFN